MVKNLLSQLHPDDVVFAAERWPQNPLDQSETVNHIPVHFVCKKWTWPKRGQGYVHWIRWLLIPFMTRRIIRLAKETNCQAIFCNFPDEQMLLASYRAAKKLKLPFYSFFHNTYRENRSGWQRQIANYIQPRVFELSERIFVMSAGMRDGMAKLYPHYHFEPLLHTFSEPIPEFAPLPKPTGDTIKVGFLGSINDSNLDAMHRFRELVRIDNRIHWNIYSSTPNWFLAKQGLTGERITHESPSDEELTAKLQSNDLLFLPHGFTGGLTQIEYETIFPTRTIPYLLSGRPIVAFSPAFSYLNRWLVENQCAEIVDQPDMIPLKQAIERLIADPARREQLVRSSLKAAEQFEARTVVRGLVDLLNR